MNKVKCRDSEGNLWERVSKTAARKIWETGGEVCFCPCNIRPFGSWGFGGILSTSLSTDSFDDVARDYTWYNCPDSETGRYCAFYVQSKKG